MLLALSINSLESIQAFLFYLMQYSITNVNAFFLLISMGFFLYPFLNNGPLKNQYNELSDKNNSPIQLISQVKGYFNLNPVLALSLVITLFSFVGIPPLIGFFAKQMILSVALDNGYVFLTLTAILTSVISAVYYLNIIKQIYFDKDEYELNKDFKDTKFNGSVVTARNSDNSVNTFSFNINNIVLSSSLTITISILTLTLLLFIFTPQEFINITNILVLIMFNP